MAQEIPAFSGTKGLGDAPNPAQQAGNCALGCLPQQRLEFAECHFDGVQVGRVGRQIKERCTYRFNRLLNASDFMHWQIVHDDDVSALECWSKALFHVGEKHRPVHRAVKHERRRHSALAQSRHESHGLAMSVRRVADQTLASRTAASQPHHRGAGAGLIDKHQPRGIKHALLSLPTSARASHLGAILLLRVQSFF